MFYYVILRISVCMAKNIQINIRMDDDMANRLKLFAKDNLTTPSQVLRKALHDYLQERSQNDRKRLASV